MTPKSVKLLVDHLRLDFSRHVKFHCSICVPRKKTVSALFPPSISTLCVSVCVLGE